MTITEFKKVLKQCVKTQGFEYENKNYCLNLDKIIIIISVQKSNYGIDDYYINYGFYVKDIHKNNFNCAKITECDIRGRFYDETDGKGDLFSLGALSSSEFEEITNFNIRKVIVPVMENGIEEYFKKFPNAFCAAKLSLKEYLEPAKERRT